MKTPRSFGAYEVLDQVGGGAFADIFKVRKNSEVFALKKLKAYLKYDYEFTVLIKTEANLLSQVNDREHFPLFIEKGEWKEEHYLIMELLEGLDLQRASESGYRDGKAPSPVLAAQIVLEIAKGLNHLHSLKLFPDRPTIHGDLRASNTFLTTRGEIKLIDLGLKGGTFDYMPLERLHDRILTPYSDLYATGHILYELTHGKRLFQADNKLEAYFEMRELKITEDFFDRNVPFPIKKILIKSLNQELSTHYQKAAELIADLQAYLSETDAPPAREAISGWVRELK